MKLKKVLVTGAGGFIGKALCDYLKSESSVSVLGIGRKSKKNEYYHRLDLLNTAHLRKFLLKEKPQLIFHLAGGRYQDPSQCISANISTTMSLFKTIGSISRYNPRIVVVGSAAEYGDRPLYSPAIKENSLAIPLGVYGLVKLTETQLALEYADKGYDVCIARLFNVIGPGLTQDTAPGRFASEIVNLEREQSKGKIKVGILSGIRDFLDIRDITEALYILSKKAKSGEIYNICSQKAVAMRELLNAMISASSQSGISYLENNNLKAEVVYSVGSCKKFQKISRWKPKFTLQQSVKDTLEYFRSI